MQHHILMSMTIDADLPGELESKGYYNSKQIIGSPFPFTFVSRNVRRQTAYLDDRCMNSISDFSPVLNRTCSTVPYFGAKKVREKEEECIASTVWPSMHCIVTFVRTQNCTVKKHIYTTIYDSLCLLWECIVLYNRYSVHVLH
jgi:hypothetical protein